jgi:hypothetical protein
MLLVSFYVMLAPSSCIFVYLARYALNLQCHVQPASQYESPRNRIPFFWDDAASVGSRILTFRGNLLSYQGVDRSVNNSRALRHIAEEPILSYTAAITSRLFHPTGLFVAI